MRRSIAALAVALLASPALAGPDGAAAPAGASDLAPPVRVLAGGEPIDTEVGHAAPYFHDMDGDGLRDLLVGQMGKGLMRVYRNTGSATAPAFTTGAVFQAEGKDAAVEAG